jgi:hypothetical protein
MQLLPPLNMSYTAYLKKSFTFKVFCFLTWLRQEKRDLAKPESFAFSISNNSVSFVKWFQCMLKVLIL